jgi:hypothetical protein
MLINLLFIIVFIILSTKLVRKELEYMLPLKLMWTHRKEYHDEYLTKKPAIINDDPPVIYEQPRQSNNENDKIFLK